MNLGDWSWDPSLAYVGLAAALYILGSRGRGRPRPLEALAFFGGLLTVVLALDSPIDEYADQLFWVHMLQHVLLLTVAPPLFLLGRPWPRMWRALPLGPRTQVGRTLARAGWAAPVRVLARPVPAWILFNATVVAWHLPAAYNLTLTSGAVHVCEHAMFFFAGLLFWARVIDPGPLRPRLVWPVRIAYAAGAMVVSWALAIALVVIQHPIYPHYAALLTRPGGLTAMEDQQIAGGVMWVPGSISYTVTLLAGLYRWLEPDHSPGAPSAAVTT
jgi:cytochrome c oxidase assembly factor CtaG